MSAPNAQHACDRLVDLAIQAGGPDNITIIIVKFQASDSGGKG
jgi:serine/threonine protein phosphatase PrpC